MKVTTVSALTVDCDYCDGRGTTGLEDWNDDCPVCHGDTFLPCCQRCGDAITGCIWLGGLCLSCHEGALLPETAHDRWEAAYAD